MSRNESEPSSAGRVLHLGALSLPLLRRSGPSRDPGRRIANLFRFSAAFLGPAASAGGELPLTPAIQHAFRFVSHRSAPLCDYSSVVAIAMPKQRLTDRGRTLWCRLGCSLAWPP